MKTTVFLVAMLLFSTAIIAQEKKNEEPAKTEKPTSIIFKSTIYDFGKIEYGSDAIAVFVFKNVTKKPVKLTNVKTSCGCTAADWPKEEIAKKKKQKISVTYDSKRMGSFNKTIYVYIEGQENPIQLEIKGEVVKTEPETTTPTDGSQSNTSNPSDGTNGKSQVKKEKNQTIKASDPALQNPEKKPAGNIEKSNKNQN
jgi:hypothetical protein